MGPADDYSLSEDDLIDEVEMLSPGEVEEAAPVLYLAGPDGIRLSHEDSTSRLSSPAAFLRIIEEMDEGS